MGILVPSIVVKTTLGALFLLFSCSPMNVNKPKMISDNNVFFNKLFILLVYRFLPVMINFLTLATRFNLIFPTNET